MLGAGDESTYPRIADGTLVTVAAHARAFPQIPDFRLPEGNLHPPRLDFGARFETDRIADEVPPITGKLLRRWGQAGRRRARSGWHRAAGSADAPRHPDRLQCAERCRRLPLGRRPVGWLVRALPAH